MLISLNYAITTLALIFSADLFRRDTEYRDAATHLLLFAFAALFGGFAHHIQLEFQDLNQILININQFLPQYLKISSIQLVYIRVWLVTFLLIGLTEYYFMRIFLYPLANRFGYTWIKPLLKGSLILFSLVTLLFSEYSLVVLYHLFTHLFVIGFSLYIIRTHQVTYLWILIALGVLNLLAGGIWSLMAVGSIATGSLHYNDWYHIILLVFLWILHWSLTRGGLVTALNLPHTSSS